MTELRRVQSSDPALDIARGIVPGIDHVNKFGRANNIDDGVETDIWDRANTVDDVDIWVAPTTARIHALASSSASDDGAPAGVGAQVVRVFGLETWDDAETFEDVILDGLTPVNTGNSYVIIHRMQVVASGASGPNVGQIEATAAVDGTITAQIGAGNGQTLMAILGIPSIQTAFVTGIYATTLTSAQGQGEFVAIKGRVNPAPDSFPQNFNNAFAFGLGGAASTAQQFIFNPYARIAGPAIFKIQAEGINGDDIPVAAGFDVIRVDN